MGSLPLWATSFSCGMWDLVPRTGIKPRPPALRVWSLGHWTIRKFHKYNFNTLLLPWTRSAEHQSCLTPTLCIPQLNTGEKSHNRTDGFYFKSYDDKTQTLSTVQQAYCISWSNLHPTWEHYCTLLSSNFPRTVPLDPQPLSFPHVLPIDEKCKGPLNDMGLNCKGPLVSDFFSLDTDYSTARSTVRWICGYQTASSNLITLHSCLSGSYDTLNEIQTPHCVQQGTAWSDACLTPQCHLLPLFPHLLQLHWPSRNVLNVCLDCFFPS